MRLIESLVALSGREHLELTPPPGYVPQGLTEEIRTILGLTTVHLTPTQIRDSLIERGFKGSGSSPKNLLINVHTVLSRLWDARELDIVERDGKPAYKKKRVGMEPPPEPPLAQLENLSTLDPRHHIHNPPPLVNVTEGASFKPKYGLLDPLNKRGKK